MLNKSRDMEFGLDISLVFTEVDRLRYILLLRGINVGGKNKVSMADLKEMFLDVGFEDVASYINSGNIFFGSDESIETCIMVIRNVLESNDDFSGPFA